MQSFLNAIVKSASDGCNIVSISWGLPEIYVDPQTATAFNSVFQNATRTTFFAASGDNGSSDGTPIATTDFPACCPAVMGCGGTTLVADENIIISEVARSGSGGGLSSIFPTPSYQNTVTYPLQGRRGVPDVCGNADPDTGYIVRVYDNGSANNYIVGGTSAVSPLWSALTARVNQLTGKNNGLFSSSLYPSGSSRDITTGNNGGYTCAQRYDPVTGVGSPDGESLFTLFKLNISSSCNNSTHIYKYTCFWSSSADSALQRYNCCISCCYFQELAVWRWRNIVC